MFKGVKKEQPSPSSFDVLLGKTAEFTGSITCEGSIRIDGKGVGNVISKGDVLMGVGSKLEGNIEANNIEISGEVHGNIKATGAFRIYESGVLFGDINVSSFVIDEGGVFEGECHINTKGLKQTLSSKTIDLPLKANFDTKPDATKNEDKSKNNLNATIQSEKKPSA